MENLLPRGCCFSSFVIALTAYVIYTSYLLYSLYYLGKINVILPFRNYVILPSGNQRKIQLHCIKHQVFDRIFLLK